MFKIVTEWTRVHKAAIVFLVISTLAIRFANGMDNNIVALLNTIVDHEAEPTNVFIKSCWPLHIETDILRKASMQIVFIDGFMYKLPIDLSPSNVMFVTSLNCDGTNEFVAGINVNQTFFKHPYRWIMYASNSTNTEMVEQINNALPDSNIILAEWNDKDNNFDLSQFYKTEPYAETIYELFGHWSVTSGLVDLRKDKVLSKRRRNLRGKLLRASVVILHNDSMNHLTDYRDRNIDSVTKVSYILLNHMIDCMNSTRKFTYSDTWGYFDEKTNTINGMLGELYYNTTDIGGTAAFMIEDRVGTYEFIAMGAPTRTKFIFRAPTLSFVTNIYYLPFKAEVWYSLVALVFVSCIVIYYTYRITNMHMPQAEESLRPSDIFLFGVSSICQMGTQREPKYASSKISTIFFVVALIFVYTSYTANIVSLLQSTTKSIKTLEDLYNSDLGFGVEDTPYNRIYFQLTKRGTIHRKIYEQKIIPPKQPSKYMNLSYGVSLMRNGFFAFHSEGGTAYKFIEDTFYEHEKCGLIEMDFLSQIDPWMVIQKHSPYKEIMKVLIREHGIQTRETSRIYTKRPICSSHGQSFESVRLIDCQIVLKVLASGFIFSFIILIMEKIVHARMIESRLCLL